VKSDILKLEPEQKEIAKQLLDLLLRVPNIPFDDVPVGKDETENKILKTV